MSILQLIIVGMETISFQVKIIAFEPSKLPYNAMPGQYKIEVKKEGGSND